MSDAALTLTTGQLAPGSKLITTPLEEVATALYFRIFTHRRSWAFDQSFGIDYADWRSQKPPRVGEMTSQLRQIIEGTDRVLSVTELTGAFDIPSRTLSFSASILTSEGEIDLTFEAFGRAADTSGWPYLMFRSRGAPIFTFAGSC